MKKVSILIAAVALTVSSYAQTWTLDKAHAKLGFSITHLMMSDVDGMFKNVEATIQSSQPDFSDAVITMTAQTNSVFTDNDKRDEHLKSADFFDATKYPTITFKSTSLKKDGANKYILTGDLTMHGITKTVTMDLSYRGPATSPMTKKPLAGFKITGKIKRSDFKIADSAPSAMLSDEVTITANGEFNQS
jgi:polyisoprenoid-binding protein YceI